MPNNTSLNSIFHELAGRQLVEIGSPLFDSAGNPAWAQQTGGQGGYGMRLDALWSKPYVRAAIANRAYRSDFYADAPLRRLGTQDAGRPESWKPEETGDLQSGQTAYMTSNGLVVVTNPDLHHHQLGPVCVAFDKPIDVDTQWGKVSSRIVARELLRHSLNSIAGQVRANSDDNYWLGDRAFALVIKATVECAEREAITPEAWSALEPYIEAGLARFEGPITIQVNSKYYLSANPVPTINPWYYDQIANGMRWWLPVTYRLEKHLSKIASKLAPRAKTVVKRYSQMVEDLELLLPGKSGTIAGVSYPDSMLGVVLTSWKGLMPENMHFGDYAESWAIPSLATAAKVLGSTVCAKAADALAAKYAASDPAWCVDADNSYHQAVAVPVGSKAA